MKISEEHQQNASQFMAAFWNELVKPYYEPENGADYWMQLMEVANTLSEKYCSKDKRLQNMIVAFIGGLQDIAVNGEGTTIG